MASGLAWGARGQTGYQHCGSGCIATDGAIHDDGAYGVGVWWDGTIVSALELRDPASAEVSTLVRFANPNGQITELGFNDTGLPEYSAIQGRAWPRDLALLNPASEYYLHDPTTPDLFVRGAYVCGGFENDVRFGQLINEPSCINVQPNVRITSVEDVQNGYVARIREGWRVDPLPQHWEAHMHFRPAQHCVGTCQPEHVFFASDEPGEALCVDTSRGCISGDSEGIPGGPDCNVGQPFVAVGGWFMGETEFPVTPCVTGRLGVTLTSTQVGGVSTADAFVALYSADLTTLVRPIVTGHPAPGSVIQIGGSGDERINGVAIDDRDQSVVVCGRFSDPATNFNPQIDPPQPLIGPIWSLQGGHEIFVAKYDVYPGLDGHHHPQFDGVPMVLRWVYTLTTPGDDEAHAVAIAADGAVWVTGAVNYSPSMMSSQLWVARLNPPTSRGDWPIHFTDAEWEHVYEWTGGHHRGLDVAMDHLDRPVFTGHFGFEAMQDYPINCLDFNPHPTIQDIRCSNGGLDAFVMRLSPGPTPGVVNYDWAYTLGGDDADDAGTKIAVEQTNSGALVHAGYFGKRSGPPTPPYVVDFDPGSGTATAASNGDADAFVNRLNRDGGDLSIQPVQLCIALPLVDDASYQLMMSSLSDTVRSTDPASPTNHPIFPSGRVALGVVMYDAYGYEDIAAPVLPMTLITDANRHLVADRLWFLLRPTSGLPGAGSSQASHAVLAAGRTLAESPYTGFGSVLVYSTHPDGNVLNSELGCTNPSTTDILQLNLARDYVLGFSVGSPKVFRWPEGYPIADSCNDLPLFAEGTVDRIAVFQHYNGAGGATADRDYWLDNLVESKVDVATPPPFANEDHIAFAGIYNSSNNGGPFFAGPWGPVQQRILMRLTVCPGDYDRDGDVDQDDATFFGIAFSAGELYADWNFDNLFLATPNIDQIKFDAEHANGCGSP